VESLVALWPALSLGCRSIEIVDALEGAGAVKRFDKMLGVSLWPFRVLVLTKPGQISADSVSQQGNEVIDRNAT
jgi:hypothetical protein